MTMPAMLLDEKDDFLPEARRREDGGGGGHNSHFLQCLSRRATLVGMAGAQILSCPPFQGKKEGKKQVTGTQAVLGSAPVTRRMGGGSPNHCLTEIKI